MIGGKTRGGENLFVARAKHLNLTIPGKLHVSHKHAHVSYDSMEYAKVIYEVLYSYVEVLIKLGPNDAPVDELKPETSTESKAETLAEPPTSRRCEFIC